MGNVLKAVATGGMSLLPGKAGKIASAIGTGGASLLPGKAGRIAGGVMGDPTAIFGGGQYRKRGMPTKPALTGPIEGVAGAAPGLITKMMGAGNAPAAAAGGAQFSNPALGQVAQSVGRAMGRIPQQPNGQVAQRVNPPEVATRGRFGY